MFKNDSTINELYNKISQHEKLKKLIYKKRINIYGMTSFFSILATCVVATKFSSNTVLMFIFMSAFIVSFFPLFCFTQMNVEVFPFLWKKSEKALKEKKQNLIDYILKDSTQIAIVNFKFNKKLETNVNSLKKSLALKNYEDTYEILYSILTSENNFAEDELTEAQTKKLIAEYELGLKMKL